MGTPNGSSLDRIDTAMTEALHILFDAPGVDAAMVILSVSDENGRSEGYMDTIGPDHTMRGCLAQFGMLPPVFVEDDTDYEAEAESG